MNTIAIQIGMDDEDPNPAEIVLVFLDILFSGLCRLFSFFSTVYLSLCHSEFCHGKMKWRWWWSKEFAGRKGVELGTGA